MTEIATLVLSVISTGVTQATAGLTGLAGAATAAQTALVGAGAAVVTVNAATRTASVLTNLFTASLARLRFMITTVIASSLLLAPLLAAKELVDGTRAYEDYQAQLKLASERVYPPTQPWSDP
jgi:hypothetical protein